MCHARVTVRCTRSSEPGFQVCESIAAVPSLSAVLDLLTDRLDTAGFGQFAGHVICSLTTRRHRRDRRCVPSRGVTARSRVGRARPANCRAAEIVAQVLELLLVHTVAVEVKAVRVLATRVVWHRPPGRLTGRNIGVFVHTIVLAAHRRLVDPGAVQERASRRRCNRHRGLAAAFSAVGDKTIAVAIEGPARRAAGAPSAVPTDLEIGVEEPAVTGGGHGLALDVGTPADDLTICFYCARMERTSRYRGVISSRR